MDITGDMGFEEMCSVVLQKEYIMEKKQTLEKNGVLNVSNVNVRKFCSSYIILQFSNEIFGVDLQNSHPICQACHMAAQELHDAIDNQEKFPVKWKNYLQIFDEWKQWDLKNLQGQYQSTISLLELMKTENAQSEEVTNACNELQKTLNTHMKLLDKSDVENIIESLSKISIDANMEESIRKKIHDAYWEKLHTDLISNDFNEIQNIIKLEKQILISISVKESDKIRIEEILDQEFICQLLQNGCYDKKQFSSLLLALYEYLEKFGQPISDEEIRNKKFFVSSELAHIEEKNAYLSKCVEHLRDILERSLHIVSVITEIWNTNAV